MLMSGEQSPGVLVGMMSGTLPALSPTLPAKYLAVWRSLGAPNGNGGIYSFPQCTKDESSREPSIFRTVGGQLGSVGSL